MDARHILHPCGVCSVLKVHVDDSRENVFLQTILVHIVSHFFDVYKIKLFLAAITFCVMDLQKLSNPWQVMARQCVGL